MAGARVLPADQNGAGRRLDLAGIALLSAAILLVVLPLTLGRGEGWPVWTWLSLAASVRAFALFLTAEGRIAAQGGSPLVHLSMLRHAPVVFGLATLTIATGTYYALLFTLAQYLQQGLGRSALVSGLTLVPWVAAFGVAGQVVRRLPRDLRRIAPGAGCLLLALAYAAISAALFAGQTEEPLLIALLGAGGLGLGTQFSSLLSQITTLVPRRGAGGRALVAGYCGGVGSTLIVCTR